MKICPNCNSEVDEHFELCWKCNYSFSDKRILKTEELSKNITEKEIDCLRCKIPMKYSGKFKFHEGNRIGFWGNIFELFQNRESFDLYHCTKCRKIEFFVPEE